MFTKQDKKFILLLVCFVIAVSILAGAIRAALNPPQRVTTYVCGPKVQLTVDGKELCDGNQ